MKCKICKTENKKLFDSIVLGKYKIDYFYCSKCSFLQTQEPYWLDEAYNESINVSDTGYILRNLNLVKKVSVLLYFAFGKDAKYIDFGGGYGMFTRMMRDIGFDFYWDDKYTINLFAKGFEHTKNSSYKAVTTFETFEHFVNPVHELETMLSLSKNIIFSTELLPNLVPKPEDWWYYGLNHGQHISFYSKKTLDYIAKEYDLNYYNFGSLHILTEKKILKSMKYILKLTRFGLDGFVSNRLNSKTWDDHVKMCNYDLDKIEKDNK